jgi:hypothetical protein
MQRESSSSREDLIAEYMQTFFLWRARYGLADDCMDELRAAVLADSEREPLTGEQRRRLRLLAQLIEDERRRALDCAA